MRFLFATMQIAMELERIADYAKGRRQGCKHMRTRCLPRVPVKWWI
ncbi:MAG: hypothetical protein GQ565_11050 [Candidatus Aegiribacteria sp.]|nr:hypothetical protein [Candidatus Aegiribacteria sp.]